MNYSSPEMYKIFLLKDWDRASKGSQTELEFYCLSDVFSIGLIILSFVSPKFHEYQF